MVVNYPSDVLSAAQNAADDDDVLLKMFTSQFCKDANFAYVIRLVASFNRVPSKTCDSLHAHRINEIPIAKLAHRTRFNVC